MDIFHVSFEGKIKAPTVRRWELRGITARRGEVDGATPFGHLLAAADSGVQVRRLFRADKSAP